MHLPLINPRKYFIQHALSIIMDELQITQIKLCVNPFAIIQPKNISGDPFSLRHQSSYRDHRNN